MLVDCLYRYVVDGRIKNKIDVKTRTLVLQLIYLQFSNFASIQQGDIFQNVTNSPLLSNLSALMYPELEQNKTVQDTGRVSSLAF